MAMLYKCERTRIIPYVITWEGVVSKHHQRHVQALCLSARIEAYIQSCVIKKTLESISYEHRRAFQDKVKWRTGSEGRISHLKRNYGWNRTRLVSIEGARTWCGHGVFTHNLIKISKMVA